MPNSNQSLRVFVSFLTFLVLAAHQINVTGQIVSQEPLDVRQSDRPGFKLAAATGIQFTNTLSELSEAANRVLANGSGLAAGDFDNDGLVDLFFCSLSGRSALYRNLGGGRFEEVTGNSGIDCSGLVCRGATFVDADGDRLQDLFVSTTGHGVVFFHNRGGGKFEEASRRAGTTTPFGSMTMAFADVDGNGSIDLYVANYRTNDVRDSGRVDLQSANGQLVVPPSLQNRFFLVEGKVQEFGEPDILYLNDGQARFTPVSWIKGNFRDADGKPLPRAPLDWGLSAVFCDLNDDGAPDLYVCNDYWTPDRIWLNDGHGNFRAAPFQTLRHSSASSMGVALADIDLDGTTDLFVVDMLARGRFERLCQALAYTPPPSRPGSFAERPKVNRNTLFLGRGDGTFVEIAEFTGLSASDWSWQPLFLDVDLDGYPDLLVASGHTRAVQDFDATETTERTRPKWPVNEKNVNYNGKSIPFQQAFTEERARQIRAYPPYASPLHAFRNSGNLRFAEKTKEWGVSSPAIRNGIILADLDNDGDLDLVVNPLNSAAEIWINQTGAPRVAIDLEGARPNSDALGAKVILFGGAVPRQASAVIGGGNYLSSSQRRLVFGATDPAADMRMEVHWRSGVVTRVEGILPNHLYRVREPAK